MTNEKISDATAARIRALLSKTTENGCTEAEALVAATKARELMDKYRLTMTDVEIRAEAIVTDVIDRANNRKFAPADYATYGLAKYCGVKIWFQNETDSRRLVFFGLKADVEMANYMYEMISNIIAKAVLFWKRTVEYYLSHHRKSAAHAFRLGMASRINQRLIQMAKDLEPEAKTATGTSLVVIKNAIVEEAYSQLNLNLKSFGSGATIRDQSGYAAGRAAGDRVDLLRPLRGKQAQLMA